jgi:hypothetical protein
VPVFGLCCRHWLGNLCTGGIESSIMQAFSGSG